MQTSLFRDFSRDFEATCRAAAAGGYSIAWAICHLETLGYELGEKATADGWTSLRRGRQRGLINLTTFDLTGGRLGTE
jgi:hypothetical protein